MKIIILFLFTTTLIVCPGQSLLSQDINNTLGTDGSFVIKDDTTTFLSVSQFDGNMALSNNLTLPVTTNSTVGVISKGAERFIHDFQASGTEGYNTFVGLYSGNFAISGTAFDASFNTAVGNLSLSSLTTGFGNSAVGAFALSNNSTGSSNSAVGRVALHSNTTGSSNCAFGSASLSTNTTGHSNSAVGVSALSSNTTGTHNTAAGTSALLKNTTGSSNCAFGFGALFFHTTGWGNAAFGNNALSLTTGSFNTAIGDSAGRNLTSGSNNTLIGYNAQPSVATVSNEITLGDGNITTLRCQVTTITALSDARDKKNIGDLSLGLDFLMTVRPRVFHWDMREWYDDGKADGSRMHEKPTAGFIAQELDEAQMSMNAEWLNLVLKSNPDRLEATPGNLLPIVVKAIQELKAKCDRLERELERIRTNNAGLTTTQVRAVSR